jgi:hypothetical protein
MILIQYGDYGPRVVLLQVLLNRKGADLEVDGSFGNHTYQAVVHFQKTYFPMASLTPDGVVGPKTWPWLIADTGMELVDAVDVSTLTYTNQQTHQQETLRSEYTEDIAADLKAAGGHPLELTRHPGHGIEDAVQRIITSVGNSAGIALLRFHGHGNYGTWFTVEVGDPVDLIEEKHDQAAYRDLAADKASYLTKDNFDAYKLVLGKLTPYFEPFASVEHHGCKVGAHSQALLQKLADLWGVPVSAGRPDQISGGINSFIFEGSVFTAYPAKVGLKAWAESVAD